MNTVSVREYKSNVVMQTIKVIQFCMVCCLESFLLPLISAENLNNGTSATNQYHPWKSISTRAPILDIVTNISHEAITPEEADTVITIYNAYFFLCVHHQLRHGFYYILRNVRSHCIIHDTDSYMQRLNDTSAEDDVYKQADTIGKIIPLSWGGDQYWQRKPHTLKSKRDNVEVKNQHYYDDIFEIALCMIVAIFVEVIPLALHYVRKKTALCWRRLQLFCYDYHRNHTEKQFARQELLRQHAVINCSCDVVKLSQTKWKRSSDQQQSELYLLHQKHLTVFAVITGKMFALLMQAATTLSAEICVPAVAESVCATVGQFICIPLPAIVNSAAIITDHCKNCYHYHLLKAHLNAQILTDHGVYILIPQVHRLLPKQIALREIRQLNELDVRSDCMNLHNDGDIKGKLFLFAPSERVLYHISSVVLAQQPSSFAILGLCIQINNAIVVLPTIFKYVHNITACKKRSETLRTNSRYQDPQTSAQHKSMPNSIKLLKSMKLPKAATHWHALLCSTNQIVYIFKYQRIKDTGTNWDACLNAIFKFDLCCCCWCFCYYRRCNITCGKVVNSCCNGCYSCCPWHRSQCAAKSPHCIYCYYLHYYYVLNQCYCCCCCTQFRTASLMYACSCSSSKSTHQLAKRCFNNQNNILPEMQQPAKKTKQQLKNFRNFFRPQDPKNAHYACSRLSALYNCQTIYWFQSTQHCCVHIAKPNTLISTMNTVKSACAETISYRKTDFINSIRRRAIYLEKCLYYKLINLADYLCRHIIIVLQVKISIPRSTALVIKVTREQQQQQQQMVNIAHDQQLKMNNLCKIFCNNWKRHRRRRRRRRRRRMNKQEQQQHQSVQLQQQHMSNEKETILSGVSNPRLHILDLNACKAIATNVPVHMILSKAPTVSVLAAMRLANTKIAMTNGSRKDVISPPQAPALISLPTLSATATASTMRLNRNRSRPNLVWLFIGLVWFEGPKYVNCSIHSSSQSPQSTSPAQSQVQAQATQTTLQPLSMSILYSQRQQQQHKIHPPRITSNLPLLAPNYKEIIKGSPSFTQKAPTGAMYKIGAVEKSNMSGKGIHSGNCLASRRRAAIMAAKRNGKHTRSYDIDPNVIDDRKPFDWLEPEVKAEADFLDEEAHSADSDRARLESIKRQILTKLGLKHKPNVSHPLPKQFIWDTIYRADGIRSVVSDFDFSENGSHQWEIMSTVDDVKKPQRAHSPKANGIAKLTLNFPGAQKAEYANAHGTAVENVLNVSYKDYLQHVRFEESKLLNDTKMPNNFTYLMHISNPKINKDFLGVDEMAFSDIIYDDKDDLLEIEPDELNQQVQRVNHVVGDTYAHAEDKGGYGLHQREPIMSADQLRDHNKYESDDFLGDTQEFITFAERGKMFKQHRLVEFSPQTNGIPNQKLFVRKAEIHIRIDKVATGRTDNMNRNNHRCGGKKTKPKLWIFQVMEKNTTKKSCDKSPQLCVTYDVDITNLGWQKIDVTPTVRDWYKRAPMEKLRLLIDCTGCGKHYVLHLFNQPLVNSKQKLYTQREQRDRNDLVVQWTRQRLNNNNILQKESDFKGRIEQQSPKAKHSTMLCNSIFDCSNQNNFTAKADNYNLHDVRSKLFRPHPLLGYTAQSNRLQSTFSGTRDKPDIQYAQQQKYIRLKSPVSAELSPNRPFLVLHTETKSLRRVRRRAIDCVGAMHGQCCKESFYVSFKALGWDDWIIAPRGYFANYCRGDCTGPFRTPDTFQTFHAHFIEEYRKMGLLNGMQPCCAPVKFSSMSLIYYGDDGIIKRDLPKMVVDECGCP